jgi:SAM-dependent methyltransferase
MHRFLNRYAAPIARRFPEFLRSPMKRLWHASLEDTASSGRLLNSFEYEQRISTETAIFEHQEVVHDLPEIYHYWSNKYIRPILEQFGFSNPDEFFVTFLSRCIEEHPGRTPRFASLGCGNCDTEVRVARALVERGHSGFAIECVDINETMLERGAALAAEAGVSAQIVPTRGDFNHWRPHEQYDAVIANQSLHHVVELEDLFASIKKSLRANGRFVTADMIGQNGHKLWPEALRIVHEYWRELPREKTFNMQLQRYEELYENWDCSKEGFEGIRAQDILPLLVQRFDFEFFVGFANVVDPFIGRAFGSHFDVNSPEDRQFVDCIHARDEAEMLAGRIKPTHIMAVMRKKPFTNLQHWKNMTPEFCVRMPD